MYKILIRSEDILKNVDFKFKNSITNSNYSLKMFLIYSTFTILAIVISSFTLLNYQNKNLETEIYKHNKSLLTQVQIFSDAYLIERIKSQVSEKFLNINQGTSISTFLSASINTSSYDFFKTQDELNNIAANNKFISSVYIYRTKDDTIVSSKDGVIMNATNPDNYYKDYFNITLLKDIMTNKTSQNWISPMENTAFYEAKKNKNIVSLSLPTLSFAQAIPMFSAPEDRIGCVIVNIDEEYFSKSIKQILGDNNGSLMILDSTGRLLAPSSSDAIFNSIKNLKETNSITKKDTGSETLFVNGKYFALTWIKSYDKDWKYVSLVPIDTLNKQLTVTKQFVFAVTVLMIIISILCLKFITTLLYKPLKSLINAVKNKFDFHDESFNDLDFINNVISHLSTKVQEMKDTLMKNTKLIENKLANDIIHGNYSNEEEIKDRLRLVGKNFSSPKYYILLSQINSELLSRLPFDQREFVTYKMIEIINSTLSDNLSNINIQSSDNCILTIINFNAETSNKIDLRQLLSAIEYELRLTCNIAVSEIKDKLTDVCELYTQTNKYLKYSYIYGYGNIFTSDYIKTLESNNMMPNLNILSKLDGLLKSCKTIELKDELKIIVDKIKNDGYSYTSAKAILLQITTLMGSVNLDQGTETDELNLNKLLLNFEAITSIEEYLCWMFGVIDIYSTEISNRNSSIDHEFIAKISQYILDNIDSSICLNSVAEAFYISPSHLSKIFKKSTGINFSDFIISKKFERAAQLLLEEKNMEINELAEKVGYQNISYFTKLFKERYGITPLQYRKKYL